MYLIVISLLVLVACNTEENISTSPETNIPTVTTNATFGVHTQENVTYAKGLSHQSLNSIVSTELELKLDVYTPNNANTNRPVYMFIHGGGFIGGSRKSGHITQIANYFASRGWVFISIDYRVRDDIGTIPQEWIDFSTNLPTQSVSQFLAMYPAHRDAKAALRWIVANASTYNINTNYITVGGGSAGAITSITVGVSNQEDYRDELNISEDSTLSTTNLNQSYTIQSIIDFWGTKVGVDAVENIYKQERFDSNDPSLLIIHGTADANVNTPYSSALELKNKYDASGAYAELIPLEGAGHSAWSATVNGKNLSELSFDFIVQQQRLNVQ
ncbi:Alpha/beta hydrolase [Tenacibaculum sp. 190130A14a]|uniref:Alpha/beta hydrolase n=2 Tax=Tenacibaculum polynesiense TaxID=3137857 RepID=A0ABP1F279_9FLAO